MSAARDRLLQAIEEVDAEIFGEHGEGEILTGFIVVVGYRQMSPEPDGDCDRVSRITLPGQAAWQTLGLLHAETLHLEVLHTATDD